VYNGEENQVPRSTLKSHPRELCFPQHFLLADFSAKNVNSHNRHRATRLAQVRLKTSCVSDRGQIWNEPVCAVAKYLA